ncbi:MAG: NFACT family protein [Pyrinomonadaceae bacterium]
MNEPTLEKIVAELASTLLGKKFGKIFSLSRLQLAVDLRIPDSRYLFISIQPTDPRIYLIRRNFRSLEKQSRNPAPFVLQLRHKLSNSLLEKIEKESAERVVYFTFFARNEVGQTENYILVVQLTGLSANLFLLDDKGLILDTFRETAGPGQVIGEKYAPPQRETRENLSEKERRIFPQTQHADLSEALDSFYRERERERELNNLAGAARKKLKAEISQKKRLLKNLRKDLAGHGEPENWKRLGDLLLANISTAKRVENHFEVVDYFDETTPIIQIEAEETDSPSEAAEKYFKLYAKARNARTQIDRRLRLTEKELIDLEGKSRILEKAIENQDPDGLRDFVGFRKESSPKRPFAKKKGAEFSGTRRFTSSEGYLILVGKRAKDNDHLTFRLAKSLDLWLHAADYPGSHVVVRNPNRNEIPPRTLLEAAQLAAFYSQARSQPKAAVHYTTKKFVNKPKGAAPGLVSLADFKTILVEPKVSEKITRELNV